LVGLLNYSAAAVIPGASSSALRRLRVATDDLHREAERHVRILDANATVATYVRYLSRMLGFHAPLERRFGVALDAHGFASESRSKRHWLAQDLRALGRDSATVEECSTVPELHETAYAVGAAYVIEGSTLGGRFILSKLGCQLAPVIGIATRFLEGYQRETGAMWRAFGEVIDRVIVDERTSAVSIMGARATFERLIVWLDEPALDPPHPARRRPLREARR
jgi:heme oxygenase